MSEVKKTRLTGDAAEIARLSKKSDDLTKKISILTKRRDGYDKARAAIVEAGATDSETTKVS